MIFFLGLMLLITIVQRPEGHDRIVPWLAWGFATVAIALAMLAAYLVENGWWRP